MGALNCLLTFCCTTGKIEIYCATEKVAFQIGACQKVRKCTFYRLFPKPFGEYTEVHAVSLNVFLFSRAGEEYRVAMDKSAKAKKAAQVQY